MDEISVVITQEPGSVSWNFEEVKMFLAKEMEHFKSTVYDDESIKTAKEDRAALNKIAKQIDEKKREAKNRCLEPFLVIEQQALELKALVQGPISAIDEQVEDYERRRKEKVKTEIGKYFDEKYKEAGLPDDIRKKAIFRVWDNKWLNATTTKKAWKEGIEKGLADIRKDLDTIKSFNSEWEEDGLKAYRENLELRAAIDVMNNLARQKERVLEAERRKKEEEERKQREAEERRRLREEYEQRVAAEKVSIPVPTVMEEEATDLSDAPEEDEQQILENDRKLQEREEVKRVGPIGIQNTKAEPDSEPFIVLKISADPMQLAKIKGYINYVGASFEEA